MAGGNWTKLLTVNTGDLITAAERNNEFNNVIANNNQDGIAGASEILANMQTQTDPAPGGTPTLATSGRGELAAIRFILSKISGQTYWYTTPTSNILYLIGLGSYRRPVLQYASATVVNLETGLDGTSGEASILFPDVTIRKDSTVGRINCNLAQVAALSGAWQSGLRTGTVVANTWYAFYAVKTTDDAAKFVVVADTVLPLQANWATLNSNFGTNGWVYLGVLPAGNGVGSTTTIPTFVMSGSEIIFTNNYTVNVPSAGVRLAAATASSLTWTYVAGTALGSGQVPGNIGIGTLSTVFGISSVQMNTRLATNANIIVSDLVGSSGTRVAQWRQALNCGVYLNPGASAVIELALYGYVDGVLGVGSNPQL
jgi:hypothetical protein